jgi:hypothetical protein
MMNINFFKFYHHYPLLFVLKIEPSHCAYVTHSPFLTILFSIVFHAKVILRYDFVCLWIVYDLVPFYASIFCF